MDNKDKKLALALINNLYKVQNEDWNVSRNMYKHTHTGTTALTLLAITLLLVSIYYWSLK